MVLTVALVAISLLPHFSCMCTPYCTFN